VCQFPRGWCAVAAMVRAPPEWVSTTGCYDEQPGVSASPAVVRLPESSDSNLPLTPRLKVKTAALADEGAVTPPRSSPQSTPQRFSLYTSEDSVQVLEPRSLNCESPITEVELDVSALPLEALEDLSMPWAQKAWQCAVCDTTLGKRHMRPRHHCRLCGASVCANCSRSSVQLHGSGSPPLRACVTCVSVYFQPSKLQGRVNMLSRRLSVLNKTPGADMAPHSNLEDALAFCESMVQELERREQQQDSSSVGKECSTTSTCSPAESPATRREQAA